MGDGKKTRRTTKLKRTPIQIPSFNKEGDKKKQPQKGEFTM